MTYDSPLFMNVNQTIKKLMGVDERTGERIWEEDEKYHPDKGDGREEDDHSGVKNQIVGRVSLRYSMSSRCVVSS